jgi:environmental stress-induced protein Ves
VKAPVLLRAADRRAQPWKNGGGVTREVAVFPAGAGMADFAWRISMADVTEAGPFSRFEGVDRVLTLLDGELELSFDDQPAPLRLNSRSAPYSFPGETPVAGTPIDGPVRDLNVMARRGRFAVHVERIDLLPGKPQKLDFPEGCVLVALGNVALRIGDQDHDLALYDAIKFHSNAATVATTHADNVGLIKIALASL